jgi:hypothetical protein
MNSTVLWDIIQCSSLRVNRRLGETYRLHLQGRISRVSLPPALTLVSWSAYSTKNMRRYVRPKRRLTFNGIYGFKSQKVVTFSILQLFLIDKIHKELLTSNYCRGDENVYLHIHSPIRLHGVVLNELSTGTTLPFTTESTWKVSETRLFYRYVKVLSTRWWYKHAMVLTDWTFESFYTPLSCESNLRRYINTVIMQHCIFISNSMYMKWTFIWNYDEYCHHINHKSGKMETNACDINISVYEYHSHKYRLRIECRALLHKVLTVNHSQMVCCIGGSDDW